MKNFHCTFRSEFTFHSTTVIAESLEEARSSLGVMFPETLSDLQVWELRELQSGPPPFR